LTPASLVELKRRKSKCLQVGATFGGSGFREVTEADCSCQVWLNKTTTLKAEAKEALKRDRITVMAF
jgi:predicted choloylglycine hydrolase